MMTMKFTRPLRATHHCRHYSYKLREGPNCAEGVDLKSPESINPCMPNAIGDSCALRANYTPTERSAWERAMVERQARLAAAIGAVPHPIPLRTSGKVPCPNCGGVLHYSRWERGAEIHCETDYCCEARFSIAPRTDWPAGNR